MRMTTVSQSNVFTVNYLVGDGRYLSSNSVRTCVRQVILLLYTIDLAVVLV